MGMLKITNCGNEVQKIIEKYLYEETGIGEMVEDLARQVIIDYTIYGYCPFDYCEEIKLCLEKQYE